MIDSVGVLLGSEELWVGVLAGTVALMVGIAASRLVDARRGRGALVATVGLLLAPAALIGLAEIRDLPGSLVLGVVALLGAGAVADAPTLPRIVGVACAVPGAVLVASTVAPEPAWVRPAVALGTLAGGLLVAAFERQWGWSGMVPFLILVWFGGVYVTVPDTEGALVLVGVAVPLTTLGWPIATAAFGSGGALAAAGLAAWVVGTDGATRASAVVGGLAAPGLLIAEPLARRLAVRAFTGRPSVSRGWLLLGGAAVHVVVVLLMTRVAGMQRSATAASVVAGVVLVATVAAVAWLSRPPAPTGPRDPRGPIPSPSAEGRSARSR